MKRINVVLKMQLNALARYFYSLQGYNVPEYYDFSKAKHPTEKLMWIQSLASYEFWTKQQ
jgi:hypothetical protein